MTRVIVAGGTIVTMDAGRRVVTGCAEIDLVLERGVDPDAEHRALLGVGAQLGDLLVIGDDLFGQHQIGL